MWRQTSTPPISPDNIKRDYLTFTNLTLHNSEWVLNFVRVSAITILEFCPKNIFVNLYHSHNKISYFPKDYLQGFSYSGNAVCFLC